jgi:hypothetical protein
VNSVNEFRNCEAILVHVRSKPTLRAIKRELDSDFPIKKMNPQPDVVSGEGSELKFSEPLLGETNSWSRR